MRAALTPISTTVAWPISTRAQDMMMTPRVVNERSNSLEILQRTATLHH
ncbi:MAG: hypothetical protein H7305_13195 [Gemmatimonadaceae bacterium]|nr:hypothetical protein [Gemmatimonadaceae bacterium]